jgi:hypothetical protein
MRRPVKLINGNPGSWFPKPVHARLPKNAAIEAPTRMAPRA